MRNFVSVIFIICSLVLIFGCSQAPPPLDSNGKSPDTVLMETYVLILEGKLDEAHQNFAPEYIKALITDNKSTFEEYCSNTSEWKVEWLKTTVMGNDYNKDLWRVRIFPDEGKGNENMAGIVQDMYIVDGSWKIVFWDHYPKS